MPDRVIPEVKARMDKAKADIYAELPQNRKTIIELLDEKIAVCKALGCPEGSDLLAHATALMTEVRGYRLRRMAAEYDDDAYDDPAWLRAMGQMDVEKALRLEEKK